MSHEEIQLGLSRIGSALIATVLLQSTQVALTCYLIYIATN